MKKIIFGIFAHPDDEAFGPAGTLLKETRSGSELHLITLTAGDAGTNPNNVKNLDEVRLREWKKAGDLLGASSLHFLGYKDGRLNNQDMIEVTEKIIQIVTEILAAAPSDSTVEFMSFDFSGLSGHIDHIVATRATCLAFCKLKETDSRFERIRLFCLTAKLHPEHNTDWLYMEPGRSEAEIDETIDARDVREDIVAVMRAHESQRGDCERYLALQGGHLGLNHFVIKT